MPDVQMIQEGESPLDKFLANFFAMEEFKQRERMAGQQQVLQQRQIENAEIDQFAELAQYIEQPEQRVSLAEQFANRMPHMRETFMGLADAIPLSERVYRSNALAAGVGGMTPGEFAGVGRAGFISGMTGLDPGGLALSLAQEGRGQGELTGDLRRAGGQEMTAAQEAQNTQFFSRLAEDRLQFGATMAQDESQFARTLDLQTFDTVQRGNIARDQLLGATGMYPSFLKAEYSNRIRGLEEQLATQGSMMRPEARAGIDREIRENESAMQMIDNLMQSQVAEQPTVAQLMSALEGAEQSYQEASNEGEKAAAVERYNAALGQLQSISPFYRSIQPLGFEPSAWWGTGNVTHPTGTTPFLSPPGFQY